MSAENTSAPPTSPQFASFSWRNIPVTSANCGINTYSAIRLNTSINTVRIEKRVSGSYCTSGVPVRSTTALRTCSSNPFFSFSAVLCRACERRQLQVGQRSSDRFGADAVDGRIDGAVRADADRQRNDELRQVLGQHQVAGRELAETEVDDPRHAIGVDEQIGAPEVAVRDAFAPQEGDLLPDPAQQVVTPRLFDPVQGGAVDGGVREQEPVRFDGRDREEVRRADPAVARLERDQRFVLDRAAERREGAFVADVAQPESTVDPEQEVRVSFVLAEHLDEHAVARLRRAEPRRRPARVDGRRMQFAQR